MIFFIHHPAEDEEEISLSLYSCCSLLSWSSLSVDDNNNMNMMCPIDIVFILRLYTKKKKNARYYIPLFIFSYSSFSGFADPFWHFSLFLISSDEIFYCVILYVHAYGTDGSIPIELFLSERWNGPWVLPWPWEPCDIFICAHGHLWNVNKRFHSSFRLQHCGCRPRTKKKVKYYIHNIV